MIHTMLRKRRERKQLKQIQEELSGLPSAEVQKKLHKLQIENLTLRRLVQAKGERIRDLENEVHVLEGRLETLNLQPPRFEEVYRRHTDWREYE